MSPTYKNGDFAIGKVATAKSRLRVGDIVILQRGNEYPMIKRLSAKADGDCFEIQGDNVKSMSKVDLGVVHKDQIVAKAVYRIKPYQHREV